MATKIQVSLILASAGFFSTALASTATDAAAAAAVQSLANTMSIVILKNQGMGANIVSTPNGAVVVPTANGGGSDTNPPQPTYQQQNDQAQKNSFMNGN